MSIEKSFECLTVARTGPNSILVVHNPDTHDVARQRNEPNPVSIVHEMVRRQMSRRMTHAIAKCRIGDGIETRDVPITTPCGCRFEARFLLHGHTEFSG